MLIDNDVKERDKWEEIIRSKLNDFEVDTEPGVWKAIEDRLPGKIFVLSRKWYYAAAVITLFLMLTGGYYYFNRPGKEQVTAHIPEMKTEMTREIQESGNRSGENTSVAALDHSRAKAPAVTSIHFASLPLASLPPSPKMQIAVKNNIPSLESLPSLNRTPRSISLISQVGDTQLLADATPVSPSRKPVKRWGFGAGGASYSVGSNGGGLINSRSDHIMYSMSALNDGRWYMETPVKRNDYFNDILANISNEVSAVHAESIPKVNMKHKQPISFGLGIGYALNNRWSIQSGLVYTMLSSEWETELVYQGKSKQQLHFIGIPLGISYTIAEWNKFRFYATAGGMAEWNLGGHIKTNYYYIEDETFKPEKESVRMKEMQWSVHANVGVNYPVIKFLNAYVEGGANYYFDNKSSIETIRSDKPFHVSLHAGLRFGF
ncbi:MAG: PorT family protein [Tannerella sp.]|jgi:hypothetical protein|nr:PorT family protein [Tannerella sp.]